MTQAIFVAPGKVVLVGEYAVLDGAPAIVAAVDRGVQCTVSPASSMILKTPEDDRFARAALKAVNAPAAQYTFTDWNPTATRTKAGLGGSAAATVCACLAGSPELAPGALAAIAYRVHAEVQGSGSGIDIAAAAWGGVLRFQTQSVESVATVEPVVVFSGRSAKTGPRVEQYLSMPDRHDFVRQSSLVADGFSTDPIESVRAACRLLEDMTDRAGIGWWTPELRQIVHLAGQFGGAAKPSGAGGGDCAIALFADASAASDFKAAATKARFIVIPTRIASGAHRL